MKRKISYEYYLSESRNRILIGVITGLTIIHVLNCIFGDIYSWNIITFLGSVIFSYILPVILPFFQNKAKKEKKEVYYRTIEPITRKENWREILEKKGFQVLVGESGIGKSFLLRELFSDVNHCYYKENNYYLPIKDSDLEGKSYIILDQFERAISSHNKEIRMMIRSLASRPDTTVIVAIKTETLGHLCRLFGDMIVFDRKDPTCNITWLKYKKEEESELSERLLKSFSKWKAEKEPLFKQIVADMKSRKITFIQFSFINKILLKYEYTSENERNRRRRKKNEEETVWEQDGYNAMIAFFLKDIIRHYQYADTAFQMMYLLSLDTKGEFFTGKKDFINITIQKKEVIDKTLLFLEENELISKELDSQHTGNADNNNFECRHEYVGKLMYEICCEMVSQEIRENIDYYHNKIQCLKEEKNKRRVNEIYKNCKRQTDYLTSWRNQHFVHPLFWITLIFLVSVQAVLVIPSISKTAQTFALEFWKTISFVDVVHNVNNAHLLMILLNAAVGLSVFYIYNFYKNYLRVFSEIKRSLHFVICLCIVIGSIGCVSAFIFLPYWAVGLGLEVFLIGLCNIGISRNVRADESAFFKRFARNTCFSAGAIIVLGFLFPLFIVYNIWLSIPFLVLYIIFMLLCVFNHINRQNILSLNGKALYQTENEKRGTPNYQKSVYTKDSFI